MIRNPYAPIDPDTFHPGMNNAPISRTIVINKLASYLLNVDEPSCVSIVAERGMGVEPTVKRFVRMEELSRKFTVVECDSKSDLGVGGDVIDFYQALVRHISGKISSLPDPARDAASRILQRKPMRLSDIATDFWEFFRIIREMCAPLLLVFYAFDSLLDYYDLRGTDWMFLRELNNNPEHRCYFLVVSRRPIPFIEILHHLKDSLFSTLFSATTVRVGLLTPAETKHIIRELAKTALEGRTPWQDWVEQLLYRWGGRNPTCTLFVCHELFEQIWIEKIVFKNVHQEKIFQQLYEGLTPYFDRLYDNLESDDLLQPLLKLFQEGNSYDFHKASEHLIDLGYFLRDDAREKRYILFSPLFERYLQERCVGEFGGEVKAVKFSAAEKRVLEELAKGNSEIKAIARKLNRSVNTIRSHFKSIYKKLGVHKASEAIEAAKKIIKS